MTSVAHIVGWVIGQSVLVTLLWISAVLFLRRQNFCPNGQRRNAPRGATEDIRARQIEYQNSAAYRAFEFFLKVTLGILGGIALLVGQQPAAFSGHRVLLVKSGAWLLFLASVVFSAVVFAHQKSKIERWPRPYTWYQSLLWVEYWFIQGMLLVSVGTLFLVRLLQDP